MGIFNNMLSNDCLQHIQKWYYIALFLIFVILAGLVMIFKYFLKIDHKSVKLGQADKGHEERCKRLEQRIQELEKNKYEPRP
jgi:hypothetical protein